MLHAGIITSKCETKNIPPRVNKKQNIELDLTKEDAKGST